MVGSETASVVSSRGAYHFPLTKYDKHPSFQLSGYDIIAPRWGYPPDVEFEAQEKSPNVLGEFVWTGVDYLGEPTPYHSTAGPPSPPVDDWPARSSYFGIVDLAGLRKDRYYLYQSVWTSEPMVHLLPHWTWTGHDGQPIPVMVYANGDGVELFLNGASLGRKKRGAEPVGLPVGPRIAKDGAVTSRYRWSWSVPFQPRTLRAVSYAGGKAVASGETRTAGEPARLRLEADRKRIRSDGDDLGFVTIRVEDKAGNLCPTAANLLVMEVSGPARVVAMDNGDAASVEPLQAAERHAFNGLAVAILRPTRGRRGAVRVEVRSEGLRPAEGVLSVGGGS